MNESGQAEESYNENGIVTLIQLGLKLRAARFAWRVAPSTQHWRV